jgi:hypothetical protein
MHQAVIIHIQQIAFLVESRALEKKGSNIHTYISPS